MKTRILMFGWEFPPYHSGGLGVACMGLTRALSDRGVDVTFVIPKKLDISIPWARMRFADVEEMDVRVVNSTLKPYLTSSRYGSKHEGMYGQDLLSEVYRYGDRASAIAKEEEFDVIYAHDWLSFPAGIEAKLLTGKPLIVHVHATEFDRSGGVHGMNREVYKIEREGMELADCVIAVSSYTKDLIMRHYGIPEEKIRVVHNGIDEVTAPGRGDGLPRLRNLKKAGYSIVLFLGRITLQKGPDYFLRAARLVIERDPKVMFVMSGAGDMERKIMELSAELGIADHVLFTGFLQGTERHEVYASADLFVMPSVSEPFGITSLEAMRMGTPVLISKQSGVAEVVKHALKVDFWDVDEMANKILSVVRHAGLRSALTENAVHEAKRLTWASAAEKVDYIVRELAIVL
jgi:glycogen(starch) synthase